MAQYSLNYEQPPEFRREFVTNHRIDGKAIYKIVDREERIISFCNEDGETIQTLQDYESNFRPINLENVPNYGNARFIEEDDHDPISSMRSKIEFDSISGAIRVVVRDHVKKISKSQILTKAFHAMISEGLVINDDGQIVWDHEILNAPGQLGLKLFQELDRLKNIASPNPDVLGFNDKNPS